MKTDRTEELDAKAAQQASKSRGGATVGGDDRSKGDDFDDEPKPARERSGGAENPKE